MHFFFVQAVERSLEVVKFSNNFMPCARRKTVLPPNYISNNIFCQFSIISCPVYEDLFS